MQAPPMELVMEAHRCRLYERSEEDHKKANRKGNVKFSMAVVDLQLRRTIVARIRKLEAEMLAGPSPSRSAAPSGDGRLRGQPSVLDAVVAVAATSTVARRRGRRSESMQALLLQAAMGRRSRAAPALPARRPVPGRTPAQRPSRPPRGS